MASTEASGRRPAVRGLRLFVLVVLGLVALQNLVLHLVLLPLINRRPERLRIEYNYAWMILPGELVVHELKVRGQGSADQWLVTAEDAKGVISLPEIMDRRLRVSRIEVRGVSVRYRRRLDAGSDELAPPGGQASTSDPSSDPPIPGFTNPPQLDPEIIYPPRSRGWVVRLDDIHATDLSEIWIRSYHLLGDAQGTANISITEPFIDIDSAFRIEDMRADVADAPVAEHIRGELSILVDSVDRTAPLAERRQGISASAQGTLELQDLRFLDRTLARLPWLSLSGAGHAEVSARLQGGLFSEGSRLLLDLPELVVHFRDEDITGAGRVHACVAPDPDGLLQSELTVDFDNFAVTSGADSRALAEGEGFHVELVSPDVAIDQPFTDASVVLDLPNSRIPDVSMFNIFLPNDAGLWLVQGSGTARAHLEATRLGQHASGELHLSGDDLAVRFDRFEVITDLTLDARVADAQLATGRYELGTSTLSLRHGGLVSRRHPSDAAPLTRGWWGTLVVPSGFVQVGADTYLDARVRMTCSDSSPLMEVFGERGTLPRWAGRLLTVPKVSGQARLRLGQDWIAVDECHVRGGTYTVALRLRGAGGQKPTGELLLSSGALTVGVSLADERALHVTGAERWFEGDDGRGP